ncbi:MAG: PrsW family intramembrane metalloprotease [Anaerolineae bacterium]|nr:PrsW family intramembrane metalloprotease [Anaerolineae bacterium]
MTRFDTRLLPPDEEEILPLYHPVWRPAFTQLGILALVALIALIFAGGMVLDPLRQSLVGVGLALFPLGLWLLLAWRGERGVQHPRPHLLRVLLLSMLISNAVTLPFIERVIEPELWLADANLVTRLIGLALTVGLVTEFTKLVVLRLLVWPRCFERRVDAVAYGLTVGLGVAVVANLRYVLLDGGGQPAAAAIHIVAVTLMQQAISLIVANGLIVLKSERALAIGLALHLAGGALLHGLHAVIRTGMVVRGFGVGAVANSPLLGLVFAVLFGGAVYGAVAFLMVNADARDEQLASGPGEVPFRDELE